MDAKNDLSKIKADDARKLIREKKWTGPTCGVALGYTQANLVILPKELAYDFLLFAYRNPKPCPILDVTDAGSPEPRGVAPGADLRTDIPKYRIYKKGKLEQEVNDITNYWRDDFVAFLLGCSFTFEKALLENHIPVRHIEQGKNVPMYITNIQTRPAGAFHGNMVVSMRPIPQELVVRAVQVTSRFPSVHGAPVHIGEPSKIGIKSLERPDFGDAVEIRDGEVPVFWACGVTPQAVAMNSKPEIMITHSPGHMFITDIKDEQLSVF
ncbi:MAG TPA: putative hydro-lyase [Thermoanaerobacterales bacterium]|nr:putative hydro-lyase [Thermoanaerobacterales bacterium]